MPKRRAASPTIRDIAAKTGYSRSTVGAALQNRPDIAEATKEKIRKAAKKMGYQQDAEIQRLMSYLKRRKGVRESVNIALLHDSHDRKAWTGAAWNKTFWKGVENQADKLGFEIDIINIRDYEGHFERIISVMTARGIRGVILDGTVDNGTFEKVSLASFCCVRVGTHPWESFFHSVCPDYAYNMHLTLKNLRDLGYERPALAMLDYIDLRTDHLYHSTFLWWQQTQLKAKNRISPLIYNYAEEHHPEQSAILVPWLRKVKPDVLICNDGEVIRRCRENSIAVPEDIGVIHLNLADDVIGWSGIEQGRMRMGQATVDSLSAQFNRGDSGPPDLPRTIMIRGEWYEAETTDAS